MSDDAEREYVEAKAAYDAALVRLVAAKKARPAKPTKAALLRERNDEIVEAAWQAYIDGERDYQMLADRHDRSKGWVKHHISRLRYERRFGPETLRDFERRRWFEERPQRQKEELEFRLELARRVSLEVSPGHSEAWHRVYDMHMEEMRKAADQSGE